MGESLKGLEAIDKGSKEFWELSLPDKERYLELTDGDFQKVINRLENKGSNKDQQILKLNFMRRLRKRQG